MKRVLSVLFAAAFSLAVASNAWAIGEVKWWLRAEDEEGNPVTSGSCIVYTAGTTTQATLYADDQATAKTNDFAVGSTSGVCEWYLPVSTTSVDVEVYSGSRSVKLASFSRTTHRAVLPITTVKRKSSMEFPLDTFVAVDTTASTVNPLSTTSVPGLEYDNSRASLVWADGEQTKAEVAFRVPLDYQANGQFQVICDTSASGDSYVDFEVLTQAAADAAWDTSATDQTAVVCASAGTPTEKTLTVTTDFDSLAAGDWVTARFWRNDTSSGTADLEIYGVSFIYDAKE